MDAAEFSVLADLRRSFHLTNLANWVCGTWLAGGDIADPLEVIE